MQASLTNPSSMQIKLNDDGDPFGLILAEQFPVFKKSPPTSPWSGGASWPLAGVQIGEHGSAQWHPRIRGPKQIRLLFVPRRPLHASLPFSRLEEQGWLFVCTRRGRGTGSTVQQPASAAAGILRQPVPGLRCQPAAGRRRQRAGGPHRARPGIADASVTIAALTAMGPTPRADAMQEISSALTSCDCSGSPIMQHERPSHGASLLCCSQGSAAAPAVGDSNASVAATAGSKSLAMSDFGNSAGDKLQSSRFSPDRRHADICDVLQTPNIPKIGHNPFISCMLRSTPDITALHSFLSVRHKHITACVTTQARAEGPTQAPGSILARRSRRSSRDRVKGSRPRCCQARRSVQPPGQRRAPL